VTLDPTAAFQGNYGGSGSTHHAGDEHRRIRRLHPGRARRAMARPAHLDAWLDQDRAGHIHYAHARIHGIGRKAETMGISRRDLKDVSLNLLVHESELDVARLLGDLDEVLTIAANERAPHKVTTWIRELAAAFQRCITTARFFGPKLTMSFAKRA
jgi:DALR anticodon binding domain